MEESVRIIHRITTIAHAIFLNVCGEVPDKVTINSVNDQLHAALSLLDENVSLVCDDSNNNTETIDKAVIIADAIVCNSKYRIVIGGPEQVEVTKYAC